MKKAYIHSIDYYLPERKITNEELVADFPEWTAEKVARKVGISVRHIANENETSVDMACSASEMLFREKGISREEIDFVLLCTQSPDYFLPTSACIIQNRLKIPKTAGALDFNLGCSGFVYGLAVAKGLIVGGIAKKILLITSETYSKFIHKKDKINRTIFGDAAAATLVADQGMAEILDFSLGTDGSGAEGLIVKQGGMRDRELNENHGIDESGNFCSSPHLYMDGSAVFNFTLEMVPKLIEEVLAKNHLQQTDISQFVFHQANKFMLNILRKKIGIPEDKFWEYMDKVGNTVSSTIPIALLESIKNNKLKMNDLVLLAGFGVGLSWGGCILKF